MKKLIFIIVLFFSFNVMATNFVCNTDKKFYTITNEKDSKSTYIRIMLDLYSSDSIDSFINSINSTLTNNNDYQSKENEEHRTCQEQQKYWL